MNMKHEALKYLERGWSVLPVSNNARPIVDWRGIDVVNEDMVDSWWDQYPDAQLSIMTGYISKIVVVDIDPKNGADIRQSIQRFPETYQVQTPSGGIHLYFKHPGKPVQCSASKIGKGIDVRGEGGIVFAPPSRLKGGVYTVINDVELAECPDELLAENQIIEDEKKSDAPNWLAEVLEHGVSEGSRNNTVAKLTGYFASKQIPIDVTESILMTWNKATNTKLPTRELQATIRSTYETTKYKDKLRSMMPIKEESAVIAQVTTMGDKFKLYNSEDYMINFGGIAVDYQIDQWLPNRTIGLVVAPPESYKSWLMYELAVSVASGLDFLGKFKVNNPGPVMMIQQEDFTADIADRISLIHYTKQKAYLNSKETGEDVDELEFKELPKIPLYFHADRQFSFDKKEVVAEFVQMIEKIRPALVVIDPLYSLGGTDDFMAKLVLDMGLFKGLRDKYGTTFLIVHHSNKGNSAERQRAWGSQFVNAFLETGWQVTKNGDLKNAIVVERHFKTAAHGGYTALTYHIDTTSNKPTYEVEICMTDGPAPQKDESGKGGGSKKKRDKDDDKEFLPEGTKKDRKSLPPKEAAFTPHVAAGVVAEAALMDPSGLSFRIVENRPNKYVATDIINKIRNFGADHSSVLVVLERGQFQTNGMTIEMIHKVMSDCCDERRIQKMCDEMESVNMLRRITVNGSRDIRYLISDKVQEVIKKHRVAARQIEDKKKVITPDQID